jgi:hypothetical protein
MATSMANPQAAPGGDSGGDPQSQSQDGQQANQLQTILGRLAIMLREIGASSDPVPPDKLDQIGNALRVLGSQNQVIQADMRKAASQVYAAKAKVSQGAPQGAPQGSSPQEGMQQAQPQQAQGQGQPGTVIQPEMQQASQAVIQALQKSSQAAPGPPQQLSAPPQQ